MATPLGWRRSTRRLLRQQPDEEQVVVLEVAERAELERYQDGHDLAL